MGIHPAYQRLQEILENYTSRGFDELSQLVGQRMREHTELGYGTPLDIEISVD